jgi:hypothetical protein
MLSVGFAACGELVCLVEIVKGVAGGAAVEAVVAP